MSKFPSLLETIFFDELHLVSYKTRTFKYHNPQEEWLDKQSDFF